jgi:hypothetical protein
LQRNIFIDALPHCDITAKQATKPWGIGLKLILLRSAALQRELPQRKKCCATQWDMRGLA